MKRLIVAFAFLTRLPMPRLTTGADDFAGAIRLYPLVGLVIGLFVAGACWIGARVDPWLGALAGLAMWTAITGALHLDGLGDVADGLGAAHGDKTRLLTVMADPHVGTFSVTTIALQLLTKLVLLHLLVDQLVAIIFIPFAARIGPLVWALLLPSLRPSGLGATIASAVRQRDAIGWLALLAASALFIPAILVAAPLILLFAWWAKLRLGGMTGDVHGAGVELVETGLLIAVLVVSRL